jgi:hypothetical protein
LAATACSLAVTAWRRQLGGGAEAAAARRWLGGGGSLAAARWWRSARLMAAAWRWQLGGSAEAAAATARRAKKLNCFTIETINYRL